MLKAGLVGPSETIPPIEGKLGLSQWQNIFFCEFDCPRSTRAPSSRILRNTELFKDVYLRAGVNLTTQFEMPS